MLSGEDWLSLQHPVSIAADLLALDAQVTKYLHGGAITLTDQPKQEMVCIYLSIASAADLVPR